LGKPETIIWLVVILIAQLILTIIMMFFLKLTMAYTRVNICRRRPKGSYARSDTSETLK